MKWINLTAKQYTRLCECRSFRTDIVPIAKCYMVERGYDPEQALETALEHLGANNQFFEIGDLEWCDYIYELKEYKYEQHL